MQNPSAIGGPRDICCLPPASCYCFLASGERDFSISASCFLAIAVSEPSGA